MNMQEIENTTHQVVVKKVVSADRQRVFEAWTKPEIMHHWYCGAKGVSKSTVDLRVGGKYTNEMFIESGDCTCSGANEAEKRTSYMHYGEYLEIDPPNRLVFTWSSPSVKNTVVSVDLRTVTGGTEVTITHKLRSDTECESHRGGWTYALGTLAVLMESDKN